MMKRGFSLEVKGSVAHARSEVERELGGSLPEVEKSPSREIIDSDVSRALDAIHRRSPGGVGEFELSMSWDNELIPNLTKCRLSVK